MAITGRDKAWPTSRNQKSVKPDFRPVKTEAVFEMAEQVR
jgi:hypothetical protein